MKKYYSIALLSVMVLFLSRQTIHAAAPEMSRMLRVSPAILTISLSPGSMTRHTITVDNLTDTPLPFHVEIADLMTPDDSVTADGEQTAAQPFHRSWITLDKQDLLLAPHASGNTGISIRIPGEINLGGFYAMVYLTPLVPVTTTDTHRVVPRVGIPILGNIGVEQQLPADKRAKITFFSLPGITSSTTDIPWRLKVANTQLQYFTAKPILTMSRLFGDDSVTDYPEKVILPGKTREWNMSASVPGYGFYTATMRVSLGHGDTVSMRTYTVVLPWLAVGLILVAAVVALFILRHRKNLRQALRILIRGY